MNLLSKTTVVLLCFALAFSAVYFSAKAWTARAAFDEGEAAGREAGRLKGYEEGLDAAVKDSWNAGRLAGLEAAESEVKSLESGLREESSENYRRGRDFAATQASCEDAFDLGLREGESLAEQNWGVEWWMETEEGLLKDKKRMHVQFKWKNFLVGEPLVRPVEEGVSEWTTSTLELALCDALRIIAPFSGALLGDTFCRTVMEERKNRLSAAEQDGEVWDSKETPE